MNERVVERILVGLLLVVAFGIVIHAPVSVWLGTAHPELDMVIKAWKEMLMGGALAALLYLAYRRQSNTARKHRHRHISAQHTQRYMPLSLFL